MGHGLHIEVVVSRVVRVKDELLKAVVLAVEQRILSNTRQQVKLIVL